MADNAAPINDAGPINDAVQNNNLALTTMTPISEHRAA